MIVAITGAGGFIGKELVKRHAVLGDEIRALTRQPRADSGGVYWSQFDLADPSSSLIDFVDGVDVIYHCAAELRRTERMKSVNIDGTRRLIAAARGRIGRWVQLSSVGAYGRPSSGIVTENTPIAPVGEYERSKAVSDELVASATASGAFEAAIVRPAIVFGPDMTNRSLFSLFEMIERGLFFYIGPIGASANYVPVENVVEALHLAATLPQAAGGTFNVSDWRTIESFVNTIAGRLQVRPPRLRLPAGPVRLLANCAGRLPGWPLSPSRVLALTNRARYSSDRIAEELGFLPIVSMEAALERTVERWQAARRSSVTMTVGEASA